MPFFATQFNSFGLDLSNGSLKFVQINKNFKSTGIQAWGMKNITDGIVHKGDVKNRDKLAYEIKILLKNARGKLTTDHVVACLPESKTFIKLLAIKDKTDDSGDKKIKNKKYNNIRALIDSELPNHIPIDVDDLKYDFQIIKKDNGIIKVLVGAVSRQTVEEYLDVLDKAELKTVALEVEAQSIARAIFYEKHISKVIKNNVFKVKKIGVELADKPHIILDLGASRSSLIYWDYGTIQFTSSLEISGKEITNQIASRLKIPEDKAEKAKMIYGLDATKGKGEVHKITSQIVERLNLEVQKAQDYYLKFNGKNHRKLHIVLTGGGANTVGLKEALSKKMGVRVSVGDPLVNIKRNHDLIPKKHLTSLTTALGLGLRYTVIEDV